MWKNVTSSTTWADTVPHKKAIDHLTWGNYFLVAGPGSSRDSPNNIVYCCWPQLPTRGWKQDPISERIIHFRHSIQKIQARTDLRASSSRTTFHSTERFCASCQWSKGSSSSTHLWSLRTTTMTCMARYPKGNSGTHILAVIGLKAFPSKGK